MSQMHEHSVSINPTDVTSDFMWYIGPLHFPKLEYLSQYNN